MADSPGSDRGSSSTRPLRLWLAWRVALAGVLPLVAVALLVTWVLLPQLRVDLEAHDRALARAIAGQIELHLLGAERVVRHAARELAIRPDQPPSRWTEVLDARVGAGRLPDAIHVGAMPRNDGSAASDYGRPVPRSSIL